MRYNKTGLFRMILEKITIKKCSKHILNVNFHRPAKCFIKQRRRCIWHATMQPWRSWYTSIPPRKGCIQQRYQKSNHCNRCTDVVVIALYHYFDINLEELWIEIGVGKNKRWLLIHQYAKNLGESICRALPFWFTFTGCDTVSSFSGRGKKTAWNTWQSYPEVTEAFVRFVYLFFVF